MMLLVSALAVISFSFFVIYLLKYREQSKNILVIRQELMRIQASETDEKLLLFTSDEEIQKLLVSLNQLIALNQKNKALTMASDDSMRKMLANISHDLKTPLTVILGYIETLNEEVQITDEERKHKLIKIQQKIYEVLELMHTFFDLAKLESGDVHLKAETFDIGNLAKETLLNFYQLFHENQFSVEIIIPETSILVDGDSLAVKRIIENLLQNVLAYATDGKYLGIQIFSDRSYVWLNIMDKGKGIVEAHQDKVFERLYTLEDSRNKKYQGSGLGLTITKRLVEAMEGTITLSSIPYEKTTFSIRFPLSQLKKEKP
ncbi:sensor histidine kinase [Isobaculum melis]|uniref:histidine kinase n=1 Tax=Isobaculum melis TaxID=142588 RepID=A0A1H9QJZ4_9LACT|nr:sensor histidine kinase [Isobaculum melis]SER60525.1 His Kinase A (phospho-acceptor) domain-containing protein [Isobaculum melis]